MISFYHSVTDKRPTSVLTKAEAYSLFKSAAFAAQTQQVQADFQAELTSDFPEGKSHYQEAKRKLLPALCFAGNIDRSEDEQKGFVHSGLLTLDIDENSQEDLQAFFQLVQSGKLVYVEAAGRSVSGFLTGAMWLNVRIEIPSGKLPAKLQKLLSLNGKESRYQILSALQAAYWSAFAYLLNTQVGIIAGKAGKDLKRLRYVAHDPDLYFNDHAEVFSLETLTFSLEKQKAEAEVSTFESLSIEWTSDAFQYAERFAAAKGLTFEAGSRHTFRNALAIALNLLGVEQRQAEAFILDKYRPSSGSLSNEVSFPYKQYKDSFGRWSSRLKAEDVLPTSVFRLLPGQRVSDFGEEVVSAILTHKKIDLEAGTGTGKNFAIVKKIAPLLLERTGKKSVIVCSLNAKAAKDAEQYGLPYITGQALKQAGQSAPEMVKEALKADLVLCNQNAFPKIAAKLKRRFETRHVFIDESHTLCQSYKKKVSGALWSALSGFAESITLLSGTPKPYFGALGFQRLTFVQEVRPAIRTKVIEYTGRPEEVVFQHIQKTDFSKKRLVIKLQSKSGIKRLTGLIQQIGFKPEEVISLYSDTNVKQSAAFKSVLKALPGQSSFAEQVKVVLVTSFVNEGLDLYEQAGFDLEFVNVEKGHCFATDEVVQFADRWRTDQDKQLYSYHKAAKQAFQQRHFNALAEFEQTTAFFQEEADRLTRLKTKFADCYTLQSLFDTKTDFSAFEAFLTTDQEGKLIPNVLAIAAKVSEQADQLTSTLSGWKRIAAKYPYFKVTFDQQQEACKLDTSDFDRTEAATKKEAESILKDLFVHDKDTLLQAIGQTTEDAGLKQDTDFDASRREHAKQLLERLPDLFSDRLQYAERLAASWYKFSKAGFSEAAFQDFFFEEDGFATRQKLTSFLTALRLNLLLTVFGLSKLAFRTSGRLPVLTVQQAEDAKRLTRFVSNIDAMAYKGSLTSSAALRAMKDAFKQEDGLTERKAVLLLKALFHVEDQRTKAGMTFFIQGRKTLEEHLQSSIASEHAKQYTEELYKTLKNNEIGCNFMQVFI